MTWQQWYKLVKKLAKIISDDYRPDIIIPSMNGGLIPATIIATQLKIKDIRPINVGRKNKIRRLLYPPTIAFDKISNKKILIIDDDAYTGRTVMYIKKFLQTKGVKKIKTACVLKNYITKGIDFSAKIVKKYPTYPWKTPHFGDR